MLSVCVANAQRGQSYFEPTHYHGVFTDQSSSIRGQSLGNSMVNLDGIANFIYNPAAIGPGNTTIDIHLNYLNHNSLFPSSHYPFLGGSYRINPKLVVGTSYFSWISKTEVWRTVVGGIGFNTDRHRQTLVSIGAAYNVIPRLYVGLSANYAQENSINGSKLNNDYIFSIGAVYDRELDFLTFESVKNEKIRVSGSFTNILFNNETEQKFEDLTSIRRLPIYLRMGSTYGFSIPVSGDFGAGKKLYTDTSPSIDFTIHLYIKQSLDGPDPVTESVDNGFGLGLETIFRQRFSLQMGYYSEKRGVAGDNANFRFGTSEKKGGFTWGLGSTVPLKNLSDGSFPFNLDIYLTFSKVMKELENAYPHPEFIDNDKRQFGIAINLKWD